MPPLKSTAGRSDMEELAELVYKKVVYTWLPLDQELCVVERWEGGDITAEIFLTVTPVRCAENEQVRYAVHRGNDMPLVDSTFNKPENAVRAFLTNTKMNYENSLIKNEHNEKNFYEVERGNMCVYRIQTRFDDTDLWDSPMKSYCTKVVEDLVHLLLDRHCNYGEMAETQ